MSVKFSTSRKQAGNFASWLVARTVSENAENAVASLEFAQ